MLEADWRRISKRPLVKDASETARPAAAEALIQAQAQTQAQAEAALAEARREREAASEFAIRLKHVEEGRCAAATAATCSASTASDLKAHLEKSEADKAELTRRMQGNLQQSRRALLDLSDQRAALEPRHAALEAERSKAADRVTVAEAAVMLQLGILAGQQRPREGLPRRRPRRRSLGQAAAREVETRLA